MDTRRYVEKKIAFLKEQVATHLTARKHQNQRHYANVRSTSASCSATESDIRSSSCATELRASSSSSRRDGKMVMLKPDQRSYGVTRVGSTQQRLIPPPALCSEEVQYFKDLYTNVLNPQYPPRQPPSVFPLAAAAAARNLAKDLASTAAAAPVRDLAFYESLTQSVNQPAGRSNPENMAQQTLLENLKRGYCPRPLMGAHLSKSFN